MNYDEAKKYLYNNDINVKIPEKPLRDLYMAITDDNTIEGLKLIKEITSCDDNTAKLLWVDLKCDFGTKENNAILQAREDYEKEEAVQKYNSTPRCPKCGCTNIQLVNRKWSLLMGFMTNKVDRVCANCKHKF
ncbi:MAG: hypothetical protein HDR24_09280 [Lachnospiraceae bacterium]|nr:hypothetical protein [Lachnospiraceae bacterium]